MKKFLMFGCLGMIGLFSLIVVIAAIGGGGGSTSAGSNRSASVRNNSESKESPTDVEGTDEEFAKVNTRIVLGDYAYTVHGYSTATVIGDPDMWGEKAGSGAIFVIVDFTIENLTKESQTVLTDDFSLTDVEGRTFSTSSDATTALLSGDNQDFLFTELQPGLPHRTKTAFKVPKSAIGGRLVLEIPEKGLWSSGVALVLLVE